VLEVAAQELIQVLVIVDGGDALPKTPRLTWLALQRANAKAVAQEQFFVE
jgi:hypothetical protein